ncbi:MAG: hypothetical protein E7361_01565 [Clostridiales bacterium]|nr:hypothetical protein [Clostridiales bacterium]
MKVVFLLPVMHEYDFTSQYETISRTCRELRTDFDVIYVLNGNMQKMFADIRNKFIENDSVKAIKMMSDVNEHKLITVGMRYCESYPATIVYSAKEDINANVIKAFITSWKSGNKIVYLKKTRTGFGKFIQSIGSMFYNLGIKVLNVYKDFSGETDIQLLDLEVVKTINQLPEKNRQLRILDCFVGFKSSIVNVVDNKTNDNKEITKKYTDISKNYKYSLIFFIMMLSVFVVSLGFEIVALAVGMQMGLVAQILLVAIILVSAFVSLVFITKTRLSYRIGDYVQVQEINNLDDKAEKYNLKLKIQ